MRKPSGLGVREIAKKLNLNISTVSRALNRSYIISKETTELVIRTANEMGYHKQRTKKSIIVLLPASHVKLAWYTLNLINALKECLSQREYFWEFVNSDRIDIIQERSITGIISLDFSGRIARAVCEKYNIPLVCINDASDHADNVFSVNSDAASAINLSFGCLYDYGHRNIAYVTTSGLSYTAEKRKNAFLKIVSERGLEQSCVYISEHVNAYHGIISNLAKQGITGIIAEGESSGLLIMNSLDTCKISVPEKMSLITWELPYISALVSPALTTVEQNFPLLAEKAVLMLESQIRGESVSEDISVPYRLHLRNSVTVPVE